MRHILTIDLEEWFHVCGVESRLPVGCWDGLPSRLPEVTRDLLDLLDLRDSRATFFVVGYVAGRYPDLVAEIRERGHRIGSHGHLHRRIYEMTPDEFARDLDRSVKAIEDACGVTPRSFRAPEWSLRPHCLWALGILARSGFEFDSSAVPLTFMGSRTFPCEPGLVSTAHGPITEVPLSTVRCFAERLPFSGGLPFRLFTEWYVHRQLERGAVARRPATVYLHPFDLERELPKARLPLSRKIMQRFARRSGPDRVRRLLTRFQFAPLEDVCGDALRSDDREEPPPSDPELFAHLRRSGYRTAAAISAAGVVAAVLGAVIGSPALLLPPAAVAAVYGFHYANNFSWRRKWGDE